MFPLQRTGTHLVVSHMYTLEPPTAFVDPSLSLKQRQNNSLRASLDTLVMRGVQVD
jgi:hypothetical protein